jgi:ABC-2 type transport system permease protein
MLAKTAGAILFGVANAFVPILLAAFLADLSGVRWAVLIPGVLLIAIVSTFLGLFVAVAVKEVFEAQTLSNFFRFPMIFLCGLFFPVAKLPVWLYPLAYALPLTYGADILHGAVYGGNALPLALDFLLVTVFAAGLFGVTLVHVKRKWIL